MKISKIFYLVLFAAIGVASINVAYAASLTGVYSSPSSTIANRGSQFAIQFTTATTGTISSIELAFPEGTNFSVTDVFEVQNIGAGTLSSVGSTLIYTVSSPTSVPAGTEISLFLVKVRNSPTAGSTSLSITTKDGTDVIDGPTPASFGLISVVTASANGNFGIGTTSPVQKLDVIGNIRLTGNIVSPNDICIGTCP